MEEKDLKTLIEKLSDHAVKLLEEEGQLNPIAFILNSVGGITPVAISWNDDEEKAKSFLALGVSLKKLDCQR